MVILSGKAQENYSVSVYEGFHRIFWSGGGGGSAQKSSGGGGGGGGFVQKTSGGGGGGGGFVLKSKVQSQIIFYENNYKPW